MTNERSHPESKRLAMQSDFDRDSPAKAAHTSPICGVGTEYRGVALIRLTRCAWGIDERNE